jgi:pimeloyl-ACP methyl ester carboxylesterase
MNPQGNQFWKIVNGCRSFASVGYTVIAPQYTSIVSMRFCADCFVEIENSIIAITADKNLCSSGKISLFTASYSGTMALRAISFPSIADKISCFCTVGTPYSLIATYEHILGTDGINDRFAKLVLIRNLYNLGGIEDPIMIRALEHAIDDALFEETDRDTIAPFLAELSDAEQARVQAVVTDLSDTKHYNVKYAECIQKTHNELMTTGDYRYIQCPVLLLHGSRDQVISPNESILAYQQLVQHNVRTKLLITSLFNHSVLEYTLKNCVALVRFISFLANFFYYGKKAY